MDNTFQVGQYYYPAHKQYSDCDTLKFNNARSFFIGTVKTVVPPLTIGLYGPWGSGKSTMIRGMVEQLKEDDYLTLVFDAWKYRHEKNLVLPLLCALQREHLSKFEDTKDSVKKVVTSVAFASLASFLKHKTGIEIGDIRSTLEIYEDGYKHFKKYNDQVENIEQEYKEFISKLLNKTGKEKLVVFVDNLDRCLPDIVVNLLEDISSFLSICDVQCVYVLAMDKENVLNAIKHRFHDFDGAHYLEKIVQVGLTMPQIESSEIWLNHFQERLDLDSQKNSSLFGFDKKLVLQELNKIPGLLAKGGLLDNPRRIERLANSYLVLFAMKAISHTEKIENILPYIFAFLLKERFPRVYSAIKIDRDEKFLIGTLFGWARDPGHTPERVLQESQREGTFKISNEELFKAYTRDNEFFKFLQTFTAPLPADSIGLLEIKKRLDLVG